MNRLLWLLPTAFVAIVLGMCCALGGDTNPPDLAKMYPLGSHKDIEVVQPMMGFAGRQGDSTAAPPVPPRGPKDFETKYLRITVVDVRSLDKGARVVLRLDEIDKAGKVLREAVWWGYVDRKDGVVVIGASNEDNNRPDRNAGIHYDFPFPLYGSVPPALQGKDVASRRAYVESHKEIGTLCWQTKNEPSKADAINVTAIKYISYKNIKYDRWIRYWDPATGEFTKAEGPGRMKIAVKWEEQQLWKTDQDWLWSEITQRDTDGNITMKCKQVDLSAESAVKK